MSLNRRNAFAVALAVLFSGLIGAPSLAQPAPENLRAYGTLDVDNKGPQVSRYIFGQFTEHLGRGLGLRDKRIKWLSPLAINHL